MPAPVTRSATTVPGSGIAVGLTEGRGGYMFPTSPAGAVSAGSVAGSGTGSAMTAGESTTGSGTGSAMTAGESTTGSGTGSAMTGDGWGAGDWRFLLMQIGEKFPGPHTSCAEAGGATAR